MNKSFQTHKGVALPLLNNDISTDAIIPSREIKRVSKKGLGDALFSNLRYKGTTRTPNPGFILNQKEFDRASILLVGDNFGCGSSREHAVWALVDFGFRVIIGQSFATIFYANCIANAILPIQLSASQIAQIADWCSKDPQSNQVLADLETQTVHAGELVFHFDMIAAERDNLINGLNPIDITLQRRQAILDFMAHDQQQRPWLYAAKEHSQ